ncbi:hypothetical protein NDU88_000439 [Pleurodeles waltl]|uniref:Reverse transcriptase domain-containing protein n=1 Tax=Pleurodeles waltl TaxID=8319 RepID=A0AAV7VW25_PLEWA|nr:hypothetical protein NDU88_000439 [Pleurodeles waltl]
MIFAARQLQKCQEQNWDLYTTFVDLAKAFDTVSREGAMVDHGEVWLPRHQVGAPVSRQQACETWTVYKRLAKKLNRFHMNYLRRLLKMSWQDKVPDTDVLSQAGLQSIYSLLRRAQVRWAGHLVRMQDIRLPKRLFYGELAEGKRTQGGQKKCFKDTLNVSLKSFAIDPDFWEILAQDRPSWRSCKSKGATSYEQSRIAEAQKRRELCKFIANSLPTNQQTICARCAAEFLSPHHPDKPQPGTPYPVNLLNVISLVIVDNDG